MLFWLSGQMLWRFCSSHWIEHFGKRNKDLVNFSMTNFSCTNVVVTRCPTPYNTNSMLSQSQLVVMKELNLWKRSTCFAYKIECLCFFTPKYDDKFTKSSWNQVSLLRSHPSHLAFWRSLLSSTDSCRNPAESGQFPEFQRNQFWHRDLPNW